MSAVLQLNNEHSCWDYPTANTAYINTTFYRCFALFRTFCSLFLGLFVALGTSGVQKRETHYSFNVFILWFFFLQAGAREADTAAVLIQYLTDVICYQHLCQLSPLTSPDLPTLIPEHVNRWIYHFVIFCHLSFLIQAGWSGPKPIFNAWKEKMTRCMCVCDVCRSPVCQSWHMQL